MKKNRLFNGAYWLVLSLAVLFLACKQDAVPAAPTVVYAVADVDQPPVPQGGQAALFQFLGQNIRYPAEAQRARIQGKVIVRFVVTDVGHITDVQVTQSISGGCDEEAARVIRQMPDWTPGQLKGKPVNVRTSLPIGFVLM